jgi:hypothetical protein
MRALVSPRLAFVWIAVFALFGLTGIAAPLHASCSCPTSGYLTSSGSLWEYTDCATTDRNLQFNLTSFAEANCEVYSSTICWSDFIVTFACEENPDGSTLEGGTVRYRCLECLTDD